MTDGNIACWGTNEDDYGNDVGISAPPQGQFTSISAGANQTCGVRSGGALECWGAEITYDTDTGEKTLLPPEGKFVAVSHGGRYACGIKGDGTIDCWGDNFYGQSMPPDGQFTHIDTFLEHTCAIRTDDTVACWGYDATG